MTDYLIRDLSNGLNSPGAHRSRIYSKYARKSDNYPDYNKNLSPVEPRRNTSQKGWYAEISREMGTPRSITPILKQQFETGSTNKAPSRSISPYSRTSTPIPILVERDYSLSPRSYKKSSSISPSRREKSVVIGPVTEMVTKQEYFRHRDAGQGKVRKFFFRKFITHVIKK